MHFRFVQSKANKNNNFGMMLFIYVTCIHHGEASQWGCSYLPGCKPLSLSSSVMLVASPAAMDTNLPGRMVAGSSPWNALDLLDSWGSIWLGVKRLVPFCSKISRFWSIPIGGSTYLGEATKCMTNKSAHFFSRISWFSIFTLQFPHFQSFYPS